MGISSANVALLMAARVQGAKLGNSATLGMQTFWPNKKELDLLLETFHYRETADFVFDRVGSSGSRFLEFLGADNVTEFDASDYEGANVVHDMNDPLPAEWHDRFDFVYDGGCLEHIYDVPQVIRSLDSMLRIGGHLVISTTGNNLMGHGFYQFSPEFFFRVFSKENGWNTKLVLLAEHQLRPPRFWLVEDPQDLKSRIEIQTSTQLYTMVIAEKLSSKQVFHVPQQSDYFFAWTNHQHYQQNANEGKPAISLLRRGLGRLRYLKGVCSVGVLSSGLSNHLRRYSRSNISCTNGVRRISLREISGDSP